MTPRPRRQPQAPSEATADILARYRDGDPAAFQELVDRYEARLVQFFYRLCWDRDRAEDLAQELFLKLLRGSRGYEPQGRLSTYIFRAATNLWIDCYRSQRPQPRLYSLDQASEDQQPLAAGAPAPAHEPIDDAIAGEEKELLRRALLRLSEPHRIVFELAVFQQMPYHEIGKLLHIPVGTVKSRMHNTVAALRELLKPRAQPGDERQPETGGAG
jgi:RNA polymerase sigma-70 factor (ECF subfamily)